MAESETPHKPSKFEKAKSHIAELLLEGEEVVAFCETRSDLFYVTDKRFIALTTGFWRTRMDDLSFSQVGGIHYERGRSLKKFVAGVVLFIAGGLAALIGLRGGLQIAIIGFLLWVFGIALIVGGMRPRLWFQFRGAGLLQQPDVFRRWRIKPITGTHIRFQRWRIKPVTETQVQEFVRAARERLG